jgi:Lon protease-like protein
MSEASEKVLGIEQLPLFPLQVVLLPNEILRFTFSSPIRQMITDIELRRNLFGVAYFDPEGGITGPTG